MPEGTIVSKSALTKQDEYRHETCSVVEVDFYNATSLLGLTDEQLIQRTRRTYLAACHSAYGLSQVQDSSDLGSIWAARLLCNSIAIQVSICVTIISASASLRVCCNLQRPACILFVILGMQLPVQLSWHLLMHLPAHLPALFVFLKHDFGEGFRYATMPAASQPEASQVGLDSTSCQNAARCAVQ